MHKVIHAVKLQHIISTHRCQIPRNRTCVVSNHHRNRRARCQTTCIHDLVVKLNQPRKTCGRSDCQRVLIRPRDDTAAGWLRETGECQRVTIRVAVIVEHLSANVQTQGLARVQIEDLTNRHWHLILWTNKRIDVVVDPVAISIRNQRVGIESGFEKVTAGHRSQ